METRKRNLLRRLHYKTSKVLNVRSHFGLHVNKESDELAVIKTTVNSRIYIHILDHFLIPSIDNAVKYEDVVFQDDNTSCHREKCVRDFLADRQIVTMNWPANSPYLSPIENMW